MAATAVHQPCLGEAVVKVRAGILQARALLLAKAPLARVLSLLLWTLNQAACVSLMTLTTRCSPSFWALQPPQLLQPSVVLRFDSLGRTSSQALSQASGATETEILTSAIGLF